MQISELIGGRIGAKFGGPLTTAVNTSTDAMYTDIYQWRRRTRRWMMDNDMVMVMVVVNCMGNKA